jgi:hypothetical protein
MAISDISPPANNSLRADVQQLSQQQRRAAAAATNSSSYSKSSSSMANATGSGSAGKPGQHLNIVV